VRIAGHITMSIDLVEDPALFPPVAVAGIDRTGAPLPEKLAAGADPLGCGT
jgi:hypothetical protein